MSGPSNSHSNRFSGSQHALGVWLIGGTGESAELAKALSDRGLPYVVTATTAAARGLYHPTARIHVGPLGGPTLADFIRQQAVGCILDASHPFACEISRQAIALSQQQSIPYLRYERPALSPAAERSSSQANPAIAPSVPAVLSVPSIDALAESDWPQRERPNGQRILFTIGYRHLHKFVRLRPSAQLFARVLPSVKAISGAIAAGFAPSEIAALRPPISLALEKALWQQWRISQVVAKASGQPGGEDIKRQVAAQLGVQLILIQRPAIAYPAQTNSFDEAIKFCAQTLRVYYPNA